GEAHREPPALEGLVAQLADRLLRLLGRGHLHEAEAAGLPRKAVCDHRGGFHGAALPKVLAQTLGSGRVGQTANIQLGRHWAPPYPPRGVSILPHSSFAPRTRGKLSEARPDRSTGWARQSGR